MRLTHLSLKTFRSYEQIDLDLNAERVLVAGLNGSGKSSVRDAVSWILLNHCDGTDARGVGAEDLIPAGAKTLDATVGLEGIGDVTRTYSPKGGGSFSVEGFTGPGQAQHQALLGKLNTFEGYLNAVLDSRAFLKLDHADGKALVLSLLNVRIPIGDRQYTLDELEVQYKQAFEDRKLAKKILQGCVVPEKPVEQKLPAVADIETQLGRLRTELAALRRETGKIAGRRQALSEEQIRIQITAVLQPGEGRDLSEDIKDAAARLLGLEAEAKPASARPLPKPGDPKRAELLRNRIDTLRQHAPAKGCVLDPEVPCLTGQDAFISRCAALQKDLEQAAPPRPLFVPEPTEDPVEAQRKRIADLRAEQARLEARQREAYTARERLEAIQTELSSLPDTAQQEQAIRTLEGRIGKGETLLTQVKAYVAAVAAYQSAEQKRQAQQAEVDRLEKLVEDLGPKGARVKALTEAMGTFEAAVNPYLKPFGWTVSFSVDPWEVFVNGRSYRSYSESQQFRIGIAFQLGIAMLSGLKFAIVDRIDMFDVETRKLVSAMLAAAPLDQILILGTREPSQVLPPAKPGLLIAYRLELQDGKTRVVEQSIAEAVA